MSTKSSFSLGPVVLALVLPFVGCAEPLDTTRVAPARGTLGEEIYKVLCERIASEENPSDVSGRASRALCAGEVGPEAATTPRSRALADNRARLVEALDRILPETLEDDLQDFMLRLLPFYEAPANHIPRSTRAIARLLERLATDPAALEALERVSTRKGYRPLRNALGLARPILAYPRFPDLAVTTLDTIDVDGPAHDEFDQLLRAAALEMATAEPTAPSDGPSTLEITRDLLFRTDADFASGTPRWVLRRDDRGLAMVALEGGAIPAPFADMDRDGLADIDALGRFIDPTGALLDVATPFRVVGESGVPRDGSERALSSTGAHLYDYFDADPTLLAGTSREAVTLFDPDTNAALDLLYGLPVILGPTVFRAHTYGASTFNYASPDTSSGALFDVLHAIGPLLGRAETDDALAMTEILLRDHEAEVAALVESGFFVDRRADMRDAALVQPNNLWDDVLQIVTWLAQEPGLTEGLLRAFADSRSMRLGQIYGDMMRYKDEIGLDPADTNRPRRNVRFDVLVDRSRPDVEGNESLFQRSISLIHDLSGVRICNKEGARLVIGPVRWPLTRSYRECELMEVNDVAELFAQSVVGRAELELKDTTLNSLLDLVSGIVSVDQLLESQSGIDGLTTHPTPEALARLVFAPRNDFMQNIIDPPLTRDGVEVESRHANTIFAWEREWQFADGREPSRVTFYQAMQPMLEAFDTYDRRTAGLGISPDEERRCAARVPGCARFLFAEMISAFHLHWASPDNDRTQGDDPSRRFFSHQSNGVSYEENVADFFYDGEFILRLHELAKVLDTVEVRPGVDGIDALAAAAESLNDPARNPGLSYRDGRREATVNDGSRTVPVTPMYLLLDGLAGFDAAFEPEPARHDAWLAARSDLVDQFLSVRETAGTYAFENRRGAALLRQLVPFLRERVAAHRDAGDLTEWANGFEDRAADSIGGPLGASLIRFADAIQVDEEAKSELSQLIAYLVNEASENEAFQTTLIALADMLMLLDDDLNIVPIVNALSEGIAPNASEVVASGGELVLEESAVDEGLNLVRQINGVDDRRTLSAIMQNLVALPEGAEETPLEVIVDVVAEVNRANPGAGTRMDVTDYEELLGRSVDFLTSDTRGMERLYDVMRERELD